MARPRGARCTIGGANAADGSAGPETEIRRVERREARRPTSLAGDPWRSRDRPDREAGHGVRRFRTQRLSALRPPRGGTQDDGAPRAAKNRGGGALAIVRDPAMFNPVSASWLRRHM